ncbi:hypothetical protein K466DRAFT_146998 [Polyporus arcularius HHB13444]|uniref:Uncharacterized protein n=1 Tax=Polyporus arcularius HHB13444 TaxID=1314778 RepID=A0A5C3PA82_9APHY|nr:hypothetical protein K466DRAFT_146998 [Polyporus arcularius HHB13444]
MRRSPSPQRRRRPRSRSPSPLSRASPVPSPRRTAYESGSRNRRTRDEDRRNDRYRGRQHSRSHSRDSAMLTSAPSSDHRTVHSSHAEGHDGPNSTELRRDRKGKQRAEDPFTPFTREDDAVGLGGGEDAGRPPAQGSSVSPPDGNAAVLSTPPRTADVSPSGATEAVETPPSGPAPRKAKQPVRIRRNAWQTIQEHLAGDRREPRLNKKREEEAGPEAVTSSQSQAPNASAPVSRNRALRPEDIDVPPSDEAVPSLLLRLSDPISTNATRLQNADTTALRDSHRDDALSAGKTASTSESDVRTHVQPDRQPSMADASTASRLALHAQHTGGPGHNSSEKDNSSKTSVVGDVAAPSHMPKSSASHSAGTSHEGSDATPADPRFLLMQKLELEKRRALDVAGAVPIPTAEKEKATQLSSSSALGRKAAARLRDGPGEPQVVPVPGESSGTRAGAGAGARDEPADSDVVVTEPEFELDVSAERRETQLRSQAQLRARLAAAKRAALQDVSAVDSDARKGPGSGDRHGHTAGTAAGESSPSGRDENLTSQEVLLKSRLKARKA